MELELKKEQFACCRALPPLNDTHEETAETIVPDYLPDIGRIVDVCGCLLLRSREIVNGRASVSGLLRMMLLYVAEDGQGLKSFAYTLPLEHTMDGRISDDSPFGFALKGHKVGETVTVAAPVGELQFKIVAVENEN